MNVLLLANGLTALCACNNESDRVSVQCHLFQCAHHSTVTHSAFASLLLLEATPTSCAHALTATPPNFDMAPALSSIANMNIVNRIELDKRVTAAHQEARYERLQRNRRARGRVNVRLDDAAREQLKQRNLTLDKKGRFRTLRHVGVVVGCNLEQSGRISTTEAVMVARHNGAWNVALRIAKTYNIYQGREITALPANELRPAAAVAILNHYNATYELNVSQEVFAHACTFYGPIATGFPMRSGSGPTTTWTSPSGGTMARSSPTGISSLNLTTPLVSSILI